METQNELFTALSKAQGRFRTVPASKHVTIKMKDGGSYSYSYATLAQIMDMLREPFSANGLSIAQLISGDELITILGHSSGQTVTSTVPLPKGGDIKGFGANLTYLRRYSITAICGVAIDEEDDETIADGKIEQKPRQQQKVETPRPSPGPSELDQHFSYPEQPKVNGNMVIDTPIKAIEAAHAKIGQPYYNDKKGPNVFHAIAAIQKELGGNWSWPKTRPLDVAGWNDAVEKLVYHANTELAAKQAGLGLDEPKAETYYSQG